MATVRTVTLPDGSTFTMSDWGDYPIWSRAEFAADQAQDVTIFNYLFVGGAKPSCLVACDANADIRVDLSDGIYVLEYLFLGKAEPPPPFKPYCGRIDPNWEQSKQLGCENYPDEACQAWLKLE